MTGVISGMVTKLVMRPHFRIVKSITSEKRCSPNVSRPKDIQNKRIRLTLSLRTHHLNPFDDGASFLHRFKSRYGADGFFQLPAGALNDKSVTADYLQQARKQHLANADVLHLHFHRAQEKEDMLSALNDGRYCLSSLQLATNATRQLAAPGQWEKLNPAQALCILCLISCQACRALLAMTRERIGPSSPRAYLMFIQLN